MDRFGQRTYSATVLSKGMSLQNLKKIDQTLQTLKSGYIIYILILRSTRVLVFHCPGFEYDRNDHMNSFSYENLLTSMYVWENFRNDNSFSQLCKLGKNWLNHDFIFFLTSKNF